MRPITYQYDKQIKMHLGGNLDKMFDGSFVYPRQLEVHLPGDGVRPCNFNCAHCQGRKLKQPLGDWEEAGVRLLEKLEGAIPYQIYGGAYTEPLISPFISDYISMTKKYENNFGIHTNGSHLSKIMPLVIDLATDPNDYISISLDGGDEESHARVKRSPGYFNKIIDNIRELVLLRGDNDFPSIRIVYLMNRFNTDPATIANIVRLAREIKVDSLRFSIPYDLYGKDFDAVRRYKKIIEHAHEDVYFALVKPHLQESSPAIFWVSPFHQDVDRLKYAQCIYSYYQITIGADGWIYRCSSTASPSFYFCRLGEVTDDIEEFRDQVMKNHNPKWTPITCFKHGARCNRIAIELNDMWEKRHE